MKNTTGISPTIFMLIIVLSALNWSCTWKEANNDARIIFTSGTVTIHGANNNTRPAAISDLLKIEDTIKTGKKSSAVIQIGKVVHINIRPNTTCKINSLFMTGQSEFFLQTGQVLLSAEKLTKGSAFRVKTPTAIAAIRGTVFGVSHYAKNSIVYVKEGKVRVHRLDNKPEITLEKADIDSGSAAFVKNEIIVRPISRFESITLKRVLKSETIKSNDKTINRKLKIIGKQQTNIDIQVDEELKRLGLLSMSIDEIRKNYGRIDIITLYSGKIIKGVILSRGKKYKVLTPNGVIIINSKNVKRTWASL